MPKEPNSHFIIAPDNPGRDVMSEMLKARVVKVFDGDGFLADVWHPLRAEWVSRVPCRFAFIDAPEMAQPFGTEARDFLARSVLGKILMLDPVGKESAGYMPIDSYRRMLCMGYVTEDMHVGEVRYFLNGEINIGTVKRARPVVRNVELEMILNGMAWVIEQYAFDREDEYLAAQGEARRERLGLWGLDNPEAPWKFKIRQKARCERDGGQTDLFFERCQVVGCDGQLIRRKGTHGSFWSCSNFPRCRFSRSD